jgi:hypothetical protein
MITANQARELVEKSEKLNQKRLDQIGEWIEEAAKLGERSKPLVYSADPFYEVKKDNFRNPSFTEAQKIVKKKLEELGFSVKIESYQYGKSPWSNIEDEDDKKPETGYRILVSW